MPRNLPFNSFCEEGRSFLAGAERVDSLQVFSDSLTELERVLSRMADMSKRADDGWKKDFIEMRRQLQMQLTTVTNAANACEKINIDSVASAKLRDGWTRMRSALALHQANWPAVKIDRNDPDYQESVSKTRATNWAFVELARQIITEVRLRNPSTTRASAYLDASTISSLLNSPARP